MKEDRILRIYTDGGCAGNQSDENLGGWGAILEFGQAVKELYGSEKMVCFLAKKRMEDCR